MELSIRRGSWKIYDAQGERDYDWIEEQVMLYNTPRAGLQSLRPFLRDGELKGEEILVASLPRHDIYQEIQRMPASSANLQLIRRWLDVCDSDHEQCSQVRSFIGSRLRELPTRLIVLPKDNVEENPRLVHTRDILDTAKKKLKYAALSYCWGLEDDIVTTCENLKQHCEAGLPLLELPQTVRDFVAVSQELGVEFVWIDRFCIVQNDTADWEREAMKMRDIYINSWLTVAADSAGGARDGFLNEREPFYTDKCILTWPSPSGTYDAVSISPVMWTIEEHLHWTPMSQRGWVLQERQLAPRTLHFTTRQLIWECTWSKAQESFPLPSFSQLPELATIPRAVDDTVNGLLSPDAMAHRWKMLVLNYSRRKLTDPDDKLPAISGVASLLGELTDDTYLAGIWHGDLIRQLLWHAEDNEWLHYNHQRYRAPTWSWASVDGAVIFDYGIGGDELDATPEILEAMTEPSTADVYGTVTSGYIRLRGVTATIIYGEGSFFWMLGGTAYVKDWSKRNFFAIVHVDEDMNETRIGDLSFDNIGLPDRLALLRMCRTGSEKTGKKVYALALTPIKDISEMRFKRVGWALMNAEADEWFEDWEEYELTIL